MKKISLILATVILMFTLVMSTAVCVSAEPAQPVAEVVETSSSNNSDVLSAKAVAAAIVVAVVGAAGAIGMAMAISKSTESMSRQPEIASKINSSMMLGIVFIETAIIYALIVAILIIFVL